MPSSTNLRGPWPAATSPNSDSACAGSSGTIPCQSSRTGFWAEDLRGVRAELLAQEHHPKVSSCECAGLRDPGALPGRAGAAADLCELCKMQLVLQYRWTFVNGFISASHCARGSRLLLPVEKHKWPLFMAAAVRISANGVRRNGNNCTPYFETLHIPKIQNMLRCS